MAKCDYPFYPILTEQHVYSLIGVVKELDCLVSQRTNTFYRRDGKVIEWPDIGLEYLISFSSSHVTPVPGYGSPTEKIAFQVCFLFPDRVVCNNRIINKLIIDIVPYKGKLVYMDSISQLEC